MRTKPLSIGALLILAGCMSAPPPPPRIPALEYAKRIKQRAGAQEGASAAYATNLQNSPAPRGIPTSEQGNVTQVSSSTEPRARFASQNGEGYSEYRSQEPNERDYNGPLALGDPGLTASLWRESNSGNEIYRDFRAYAPMDLITIVVTEKTKADGSADTETKESADISASIPNFLGLESTIAKTNPQISLSKLITASTTNDFKGEGTTNREGNLTAKISGVVVEVLPGGLLRIEGEKIISVNAEEQNLVITGLVRTRDISSNNEIDSSKIANLRIDYYGKGIIGEAQDGGWMSRLVRRLWPF